MAIVRKDYFADLPADLVSDIAPKMREILPGAPFVEVDASVAEIELWLDVNRTRATMRKCFDRVPAFKITA